MRNGTPGFQSERLVEGRDSRGLTQVALADLINRTSSSISRWEAGNQSPEPEALDTLARALNRNRSVKTPVQAAARSSSAGCQCQGRRSAICRAG